MEAFAEPTREADGNGMPCASGIPCARKTAARRDARTRLEAGNCGFEFSQSLIESVFGSSLQPSSRYVYL